MGIYENSITKSLFLIKEQYMLNILKKSPSAKRCLFTALVLCLGVSANAHAGFALWAENTVTTGNGLTGTGEWGNPAANPLTSLHYQVLIGKGADIGLWKYNYILDPVDGSKGGGAVSHSLIGVSDTFTRANFKVGSGGEMTTSPGEIKDWEPTGDSGSNPHMPGNLFGIKFDFGGDPATYMIVTNRAPKYGDFFAKNGKVGGNGPLKGQWNTIWNSGFGTAGGAIDKDYLKQDWIITPDTVTVVPLPATAWMFGTALFGLIGLTRRKLNSGV